MKRRDFFRNGMILSGLGLISPTSLFSNNKNEKGIQNQKIRRAKNLIFMVSDGMSSGTLQMSNVYHRLGKNEDCAWINGYKSNFLKRSLMDTSSANSLVTDSSAGSSAFGSGKKVNNGVLNIGKNGESYETLWKKLLRKGKKTGLVTTVSVTHATPAGFCVSTDSRNNEELIAEEYLTMQIDVLLGAGKEFFDGELRSDKKDLFTAYKNKGYQVIQSKSEFNKLKNTGKTLGIFNKSSLPFSIDHRENMNTPTLSEMAEIALKSLNHNNENGFALLIEAGKVDWAAHANDLPALIHDQLEFDKTLSMMMEFAEKDGDTLLVVTTDHGNANPGILYGKNTIENFNKVPKLECSNEYLLNGIHDGFSVEHVKEWIGDMHHWKVDDNNASKILAYYKGIEKEDGLYNYKKVPFQYYSELLKSQTDVGWVSMNHTGDHVELGSYGPGSELINGFVQNIDLHEIILQSMEV